MAKAKSKTKSKSNFDLKKVLLAKGEYIVLGIAGLCLLFMLFSGVSSGLGASDPTDKVNELTKMAAAVDSAIKKGTPTSEDEKPTAIPEWAKAEIKYPQVAVNAFPVSVPFFDSVGKPGTKRENPRVIAIGDRGIGDLKYQVDLIRAPMLGYDISGSGENAKIAVLTTKSLGKLDQAQLERISPTLLKRNQRAKEAEDRMIKRYGFNPFAPVADQPGVRPGVAPPPQFNAAGVLQTGGYNTYGGQTNTYESKAERAETTIKYVPLAELDQSIKDGKLPAMTVIPLRMVVIHAEIPWKKQLEEVKRACRLQTLDEARNLLSTGGYDGYEVKRQITRLKADGQEDMIQDWAEYKFEDQYIEKIGSRSLADNFEDGYMSYFIPYDMYMALPLPQLVSELGTYPKIRLDGINKTIQKLKDLDTKPLEPSALHLKLSGQTDRRTIYSPKTGTDTGATALGWRDRVTDFDIPKAPMGALPPFGMGAARPVDPNATAPPIEIDNLLLRFVDVDVRPGYTYRYQIRLRMKNPNFGKDKEVANPAFAQKEILESQWTVIADPIDVPQEDFLYAGDVAAYREKIEKETKDQRELRDRLQVKDNQAVVEMCRWMEQVRTDSGGKREPLGAWVVAEMPVGRGEYIGRKQYVKLPLWSSVARDFILREMQDAIPHTKTKPKGWLVDFSTKSLLVDFEGGKVVTKAGGRSVTEDVATEMLIVRPDGKPMIKSSLIDQADSEENKDHKNIVRDWEKWVKDVEARKAPSAKDDFKRGEN